MNNTRYRSKDHIAEGDLANNRSERTPVILCLDTSGSMEGDKINRLNQGIRSFYDYLRNDPIARLSVEVAIVTFDSEVKLFDDFSLVEHKTNPNLTAQDGTALGHGLEMALEVAQNRKEMYKANGIDYKQPNILLMTDGQPGDMDKVNEMMRKIHLLETTNKLMLYPVAIGDDADLSLLNRISSLFNPAYRIEQIQFEKFFKWFSKSIAITSKTSTNEVEQNKQELVTSWRSVLR